MATNGNDNIVFSGTLQGVSLILVNAYSGETVEITGDYLTNNAVYDGLDGTDTVFMTGSADLLTIRNGLGEQTLYNVEILQASSGGDVINLSDATIILGNMTINGSNGNDFIWANAGNDTINGGSGNDIIDGGLGDDILNGDSNNDTIRGGEGNDTIRGGQGSDILFGGAGNDTYIVEDFLIVSGEDRITELSGSDVNVLQFQAGQSLSALSFTVDGQDLVLSYEGGVNTIRLVGQFDAPDAGIDTLAFHDGSVFTLDAPMLSGGQAATSYAENDAATVINPTLDVTDEGSAQLSGAVVTISGGFTAGQDVLAFADQNGITGSFDAGTGVLTLSGAASAAEYQAALQSVTYTNTSEAPNEAPRTITFQVNDGSAVNNLSNIATTTVSIAAVNDAPTAAATNSLTLDEDTASAPVSIGASDIDGDTLSYSVKTGFEPAKGSVAFENGNFIYTPSANANGDDSFTILIDDGQGGVAEQVVSVTINAAGDGPEAPATNSVTLDEDTASSAVAIGASDTDGDVLSYSLKTGSEPAKGAVAFDNGNFTYTPVANANGDDSFTILINDGQGGVTEQVVSVTINAINDGPTAPANNTVTTNQGAASTAVAIDAADLDGDTLSYAVKPGFGPGKGTVAFNNGQFVYTPGAGKNGADSFTILVSDGHGGTTEQAVSVNITPLAPAPTDIALSNANVLEYRANGTVVGTLSAVQPGAASALTYTLTNNAGGRFKIVGNQLQVADGIALDYEQAKSHIIQIKVTNAAGQSYLENFTINVGNVATENVTGDSRGNTIVGGTGNDIINGGAGADTLKGGTGNDRLTGGDGNDKLYGEGGNDALYGGNGDDALYATTGNDTLYGDAGNDTMYAGAGNDLMNGGAGNDTLYGEAGNDIIYGGDGNNVAYGGAGNDILWGGNGNDTLYGEDGNDILWGGNGNDTLYGEDGNDILYSNNGSDRLYGGAGNDILYAGNHGDTLDGGAGNDTVLGASGADVLKGGAGNDSLYGGSGADQFILDASGTDTIRDFSKAQGDRLNITDLLSGFDQNDKISDFVKMVVTKGDTYVQVNADGKGNDFKTVAILDNVSFKNIGELDDYLITNKSVIV